MEKLTEAIKYLKKHKTKIDPTFERKFITEQR